MDALAADIVKACLTTITSVVNVQERVIAHLVEANRPHVATNTAPAYLPQFSFANNPYAKPPTPTIEDALDDTPDTNVLAAPDSPAWDPGVAAEILGSPPGAWIPAKPKAEVPDEDGA